jgi:hypothetical protein
VCETLNDTIIYINILCRSGDLMLFVKNAVICTALHTVM